MMPSCQFEGTSWALPHSETEFEPTGSRTKLVPWANHTPYLVWIFEMAKTAILKWLNRVGILYLFFVANQMLRPN